jgi:hypothetical protein
MKRVPLLVVLSLLCLLVAAPAVQAAKPTPFAGAWTGNDPAPPDGDGSLMYLFISGGANAHILFIDTFGTICVNNDAPTTLFVGSLKGTVTGDTLAASFKWARCGPVFLDVDPITWTYDSTSDTISDSIVTWHRL